MGCTSPTLWADLCPVAPASRAAMSPTHMPIFILSVASFVWRFFMRYQQQTATQKTAPTIHDEMTV